MPDPVIKGHGSLAHAYRWYVEVLPQIVRDMVDAAGFGGFVRLLEKSTNDLVHMYALAERWWDTTNTFHLPFGEMTMTPYNFSMITGLRVGGQRLILSVAFKMNPILVQNLIGGMPPSMDGSRFPYNWLWQTYCKEDHGLHDAQLLRVFLLYVLGCSVFSTRNDRVSLNLLGSLTDIDDISTYDWGGAALALLYKHMGKVSRGTFNSTGGYW